MPVTRLHSAISSHVRSEKGTSQSHSVSSPARIANWPEGLPSKNVSSCSSAQRWRRNCWYHSQGIFLKLINNLITLNKGTHDRGGVWISDLDYHIFVSILFLNFLLNFISADEIYQTLKTVVKHISKHSEALQSKLHGVQSHFKFSKI